MASKFLTQSLAMACLMALGSIAFAQGQYPGSNISNQLRPAHHPQIPSDPIQNRALPAQRAAHELSNSHSHGSQSGRSGQFAIKTGVRVYDEAQASNVQSLLQNRDQRVEQAGYHATPVREANLVPSSMRRNLESEPGTFRDQLNFKPELMPRNERMGELRTGGPVESRVNSQGSGAPSPIPQVSGARESEAQLTKQERDERFREMLDASPESEEHQKPQFMSYIQAAAINTGIVLVLGVGFILIAKKKGAMSVAKPRQQHNAPEQTNGNAVPEPKPGMELEATLKLSPQSEVHLIRSGQQRVMVASNSGRVQAMTTLPADFQDLMDEDETDADAPQESENRIDNFSVEEFLRCFQSSQK